MAAVAMPTQSAFAMKNRTIVLRATGSGAVVGLAAGLVSYPFAKSTSTIIAGVVVGALLGTVYGFYLVDRRDDSFRSTDRGPGGRLDEIELMNETRNANLRRGKRGGAEFALPVSVLEF
jgi:hypothetical protein